MKSLFLMKWIWLNNLLPIIYAKLNQRRTYSTIALPFIASIKTVPTRLNRPLISLIDLNNFAHRRDDLSASERSQKAYQSSIHMDDEVQNWHEANFRIETIASRQNPALLSTTTLPQALSSALTTVLAYPSKSDVVQLSCDGQANRLWKRNRSIHRQPTPVLPPLRMRSAAFVVKVILLGASFSHIHSRTKTPVSCGWMVLLVKQLQS